MKRFLSFLLKAAGVFLIYQAALRLVRRYLKFPAPAFIGRFLDSDYRRTMQPADLLVQRSGIRSGMKVLEIGCGSGAFTTFSAGAVGSGGQVYALDIQPAMLRQLQQKLRKPENRGIKNLQMVSGSAHELPFAAGSLDVVYMVTVFQEIPGKARLLREVQRVLKPDGRLSITEFLPDPDYPWVTTTIKMGKDGGFAVEDVEGNLWNYTVRLKKG